MRGATLFSGGGGVEALLKTRIDFVHAVEYDPAIAAVYRANHGDHVHVADVCDLDYATWGQLDYLHASPVCKEFSQAKTNGSEGETDIQTALAVVRCLEQTTPRVFTLENVGAYQRSKSYRLICRTLDLAGYMWHAEVLNSADFGVPQTRRRLILRAVKDALLPGLAAPDPWVGWYAAIEDLIPGLPESKFAAWQLARLPAAICSSTLFSNQAGGFGTNSILDHADHDKPSITVVAAQKSTSAWKAFIVSNAATEYGDGIRDAAEPCHSITAQAHGRTRAWLVDGDGNRSREPTVLDQDDPSMTIQAWHGRRPVCTPRAWLAAGRVVRMTPRALARFQSLPDAFILPDKASLACTVIGNAVPSLMIRKIVEPLL